VCGVCNVMCGLCVVCMCDVMCGMCGICMCVCCVVCMCDVWCVCILSLCICVCGVCVVCASVAVHRLSLGVVSQNCSSCGTQGFSLRWLFLLQSMSSRAHRLEQLWHMGSVALGHAAFSSCGTWVQLPCSM